MLQEGNIYKSNYYHRRGNKLVVQLLKIDGGVSMVKILEASDGRYLKEEIVSGWSNTDLVLYEAVRKGHRLTTIFS